jgi:cob(I)alamin adenosyltransferase
MSMNLYTRTGDKGETSVIGGRVAKDDARVEAYGTIDECNAFVGLAICQLEDDRFGERYADLRSQLRQVQHELFDCGSDLSYVRPGKLGYKVTEEMAARLESWIDQLDGEAPPLKRFILPGGSPASAALHVCRTVCRRAERRVVTLGKQREINWQVAVYLNRLSDYFFAAARAVNARAGVADTEYERSGEVFR